MRQIVFRGKTPAKSSKGSRWIFGDLFRTIETRLFRGRNLLKKALAAYMENKD